MTSYGVPLTNPPEPVLLIWTLGVLPPPGEFRHVAEIMAEAHLHGIAQVIICPHEHAEMYRERLEQYGLTSTIEPV